MFLELLLQINVWLGGRACVQKDHNCDYCNPFRIESAAHALTVRSSYAARCPRMVLIVDCNHFAVSPIALVSSSCA